MPVPFSILVTFSFSSNPIKREIVRRSMVGSYDPRTDHWRGFRSKATRYLHGNMPALDFMHYCAHDVHPSKQGSYSENASSLIRWVNNRSRTSMGIEKHDQVVAGLDVRVNPEIHSLIDGTPYIIRLYNNIDPVELQLAQMHVHLLETAFRATHPDHVIGLLDVRRERLFTGSANDNYQHILENQASLWIHIASEL